MTRWRILLRHDWPLHLVLMLTNWLPDNVVFFRLRGILARPFLGSCGRTLNVWRNVTFYNPSHVHLGDHVHISYGCVVMAIDHIWIEDEVMLGPYCVLVSQNHTRSRGSYRFGDPELTPICIGKGTWLGAHVTVTAGTRIGGGSVVAAGAVVAQDIPKDTLAGGVPARVIKTLTDWDP